ncbi:MAG: hypothetical protein RMY36_010260 [Nostoc sp. SerVER01]|nr:hypothetical protein [Nostoc sp. SerVER01]
MAQSLVAEPRYDLWRVTIPINARNSRFDIYYLCAERDMAYAVLHCIYGHYNGYSVDVEKEYYPLIRKEYPTAIVIPPMPCNFKQLVHFISLQAPVWD